MLVVAGVWCRVINAMAILQVDSFQQVPPEWLVLGLTAALQFVPPLLWISRRNRSKGIWSELLALALAFWLVNFLWGGVADLGSARSV